MGWKIIEVNKNCHVKLFLDNLILSGEEKISIPLSNIDLILFTNNRTNISINSLNKIALNNIACVFCDESYKPTSQLIPFIGNHLTISIFQKQINWDQKFKNFNWKIIISQKILNQFEFAGFYNLCSDEHIETFTNYLYEVDEGDTKNREGHAAKLYWLLLFGESFKRHDDDIVNSLLNFGYTILNSMICRSIIKKGLDPRISICHKSVHNHYALASDIIEPFRTIVDIFVYSLYKEKIINVEPQSLSRDLKQALIDFIANFKVMVNGLYQFTNNAIDIYIDHLINNELKKLSIKYNFETKIKEKENEL